MTRISLTKPEARAVVRGEFVRVELGRWVSVGEKLHARSALVGRAEGEVRAYYNVCQHQPVELDMPPEPGERPPSLRRAPMAEDGVHFMCNTHGALYRPTDGRCVLGPCYGASLFSLGVEETAGGGIVLVLAEAPALDRKGEPT